MIEETTFNTLRDVILAEYGWCHNPKTVNDERINNETMIKMSNIWGESFDEALLTEMGERFDDIDNEAWSLARAAGRHDHRLALDEDVWQAHLDEVTMELQFAYSFAACCPCSGWPQAPIGPFKDNMRCSGCGEVGLNWVLSEKQQVFTVANVVALSDRFDRRISEAAEDHLNDLRARCLSAVESWVADENAGNHEVGAIREWCAYTNLAELNDWNDDPRGVYRDGSEPDRNVVCWAEFDGLVVASSATLDSDDVWVVN